MVSMLETRHYRKGVNVSAWPVTPLWVSVGVGYGAQCARIGCWPPLGLRSSSGGTGRLHNPSPYSAINFPPGLSPGEYVSLPVVYIRAKNCHLGDFSCTLLQKDYPIMERWGASQDLPMSV